MAALKNTSATMWHGAALLVLLLLASEQMLVSSVGVEQQGNQAEYDLIENEAQKFKVQDLPTAAVTVFSDRAEVERTLKFRAKPGITQIRVSNITLSMIGESVRIRGSSQSANITIQEVSTNLVNPTQPLRPSTPTTVPDENKPSASLAKLVAIQEQQLADLHQQKNWLYSWLNSHLGTEKTCSGVQDATAQLEWFSKATARIGLEVIELQNTLLKTKAQLAIALADEAKELPSQAPFNEVVVVVQNTGTEEAEVELKLVYQVSGASWASSYDIRLSSSDRTSAQLFFYGKLINSCGEDWVGASVSLSTAAPAVGSSPPKLPTARAVIGYQPEPTPRWTPQPAASYSNLFGQKDYVEVLMEPVAIHPIDMMTAAVSKSSITATFKIPRKATILSDSVEHKLTVTIMNLPISMSYVVVPSVSQSAYLRAKFNNTGDFPLLQGSVSVFIDSNFITKSELPETNIGETMSVYLGVDPAIVVESKPPRESQGQVGILTKSNTKEVVHRFSIKNTKDFDVVVDAYDQLPLSSDERVKVTLLEPVILPDVSSTKLNEFNNVRWQASLTAGQKKEMTLRYTVEWPLKENLAIL